MDEKEKVAEPRLIECTCDACSGKLEFEALNDGTTVQCPHCGMETLLFIPSIFKAPIPAQAKHPSLIATTSNEVSGRTIETYLGIVRGIVVRGATGSQELWGSLKQNWVGGNIESWAQVCDQAREDAFERMLNHARRMDADAVIAVRFDTSEFGTATEVLVYGTAVKLEKPALRAEARS